MEILKAANNLHFPNCSAMDIATALADVSFYVDMACKYICNAHLINSQLSTFSQDFRHKPLNEHLYIHA